MNERARTLPLRVLESIRRHRLWDSGDRVLLAVSGGVDSMVLLHVVHEMKDAHGGVLSVASVDHGLRPESAAEVDLVGRAAASLDLPFHSLQLALEPGPNLQARARDARRSVLLGIGSDRIATGHHLDDQAETVLFHLLRGSGARGLRGMQHSLVPWCRPLLGEPRAVLVAWAKEAGLVWVEDPSNARSQRGHLRTLLPELDAVHGGAAGALARSARLLAREDDLLETLTDEAWHAVGGPDGVRRVDLDALHPALQLRVLRRLVAVCPVPVRADPLEAVVSGALRTPGSLDLGGGWRLEQEAGLLRVVGPGGEA